MGVVEFDSREDLKAAIRDLDGDNPLSTQYEPECVDVMPAHSTDGCAPLHCLRSPACLFRTVCRRVRQGVLQLSAPELRADTEFSNPFNKCYVRVYDDSKDRSRSRSRSRCGPPPGRHMLMPRHFTFRRHQRVREAVAEHSQPLSGTAAGSAGGVSSYREGFRAAELNSGTLGLTPSNGEL